jgi:hypothetical protein
MCVCAPNTCRTCFSHPRFAGRNHSLPAEPSVRHSRASPDATASPAPNPVQDARVVTIESSAERGNSIERVLTTAKELLGESRRLGGLGNGRHFQKRHIALSKVRDTTIPFISDRSHYHTQFLTRPNSSPQGWTRPRPCPSNHTHTHPPSRVPNIARVSPSSSPGLVSLVARNCGGGEMACWLVVTKSIKRTTENIKYITRKRGRRGPC